MTNIPEADTLWNPTIGSGEYTPSTVLNVVDPSGLFLVDPSGVFIVDTGVLYNDVPATVYTESDGS